MELFSMLLGWWVRCTRKIGTNPSNHMSTGRKQFRPMTLPTMIRHYRLRVSDDGGIGPRHEALSVATGWSLSGHQTVSSPLVSRTCTRMSRDGGSRRNQ